MAPTLEQLIAKIADRDGSRTEAMVQADIRALLLAEPLGLREDVLLESQAGGQRRIDVEVGATIIEVKKDLRKGNVLPQAVKQLQGYVRSRQDKFGVRFVGVLTDGADWRCYHLVGDQLAEVAALTVQTARPDVDGLLVWLEGVLATAKDLKPTPDEVRLRLGARSSSHALDHATLAALYTAHRDLPSVQTKRRLWARLLQTALGTQFEDRDELFVEHTLLVNSAEVIAHAVLGLEIEQGVPRSLLTGVSFDQSGIRGVVEEDFFDWVVEVPEGEVYVRSLARRLARFDWSEVQHDILKVLYQSVIPAETRKKLGEYYTPDWLARQVVEATPGDPLGQRVLDPSCGSGTFLFHAIRRYLAAAKAAKVPDAEALEGVTTHVLGIDLHPVAVTLARVTYLLAIGRKLLSRRRHDLRVPVFLGDSMQWLRDDADVLKTRDLTVSIADGRDLVGDEAFRFPIGALADAACFDELVHEMADRAAHRRPGSPAPAVGQILRQVGMPSDLETAIAPAMDLMCRLHDTGRDHIWSYFIRNMARPVWLSREDNQVDVLVGNPPWLSFRFMSATMQAIFRDLSESRGLWAGARVAPHQDLSGLFVARVIQLYLREGGRFGFVLPDAALDRAHYAGFRSGSYADQLHPVAVAFTTSWDLRHLRPHFFPRGAAVAFGRRVKKPVPMPRASEVWKGRLPAGDTSWEAVSGAVTRSTPTAPSVPASDAPRSPYHDRFANGATLFPRLLFIVRVKDPGPLGITAGRAHVESVRTAKGKAPWKNLPSLTGVVETEFLRPVYLGEHILPFRALEGGTTVLPVDHKGRIYAGTEILDSYRGLSAWWAKAEALWEQHRSSDRLTLTERMNYQQGLRNQFRIPSQRVLYNSSGTHLCATRLRDNRAVIENSLYWATVPDVDEGRYLCAVLNAAVTTAAVLPLMSYGKDERHIHKHVWRLPIPQYDPDNALHAKLAALGKAAEELAAKLEIDPELDFAASRRMVRTALAAADVGPAIEKAVKKLLKM